VQKITVRGVREKQRNEKKKGSANKGNIGVWEAKDFFIKK